MSSCVHRIIVCCPNTLVRVKRGTLKSKHGSLGHQTLVHHPTQVSQKHKPQERQECSNSKTYHIMHMTGTFQFTMIQDKATPIVHWLLSSSLLLSIIFVCLLHFQQYFYFIMFLQTVLNSISYIHLILFTHSFCYWEICFLSFHIFLVFFFAKFTPFSLYSSISNSFY